MPSRWHIQAQRKKRAARASEARAAGVTATYVSVLLEELQNVLRRLVGLTEHGGRRLHQNLRPGEVRGFGGEIGIRDGAFRARHILKSDVQGVDRRIEGVGLEGSKTAAQVRD